MQDVHRVAQDVSQKRAAAHDAGERIAARIGGSRSPRRNLDPLGPDEQHGPSAHPAVGARRTQFLTRGEAQPCDVAGLRHHRAFDQVRFAEKAAHERVGRMLVYFSGRSDLIDPAVIQDGDAVGHAHRLFLIVRDVQHGHAEPLLDFLDLDLHLEAQILVEGAERLVHQHDRRVKDDRAGQCDTLLLPARQLMRVAIGEAAEPHQVERPIHPLGDVVFGPAPSAQRESHILEDVQVGKDRIILKHHAETALLRRHGGDILAVEDDGALIWPHKPGDHHQSGGLARARRPEQ